MNQLFLSTSKPGIYGVPIRYPYHIRVIEPRSAKVVIHLRMFASLIMIGCLMTSQPIRICVILVI